MAVSLAFLVLAVSLAWTVAPWFHFGPDSSLYIATARSLASGSGYTYLGAPFTLRPPGFPLLIAPLIAWRGVDFHALHLLVASVGLLGAVALYFWLRPRMGWLMALAGVACMWLNPAFSRQSNRVMADIPSLALLLICFVLDRRAAEARSWRGEVWLGLAVGVACIFRSAAILLIPSIILARLLARPGEGVPPRWQDSLRRVALSAGIASAITLCWVGYSSLSGSAGPSDQTRLHSYVTFMIRTDVGDPESELRDPVEILSRPLARGPTIARAVGRRLAHRDSDRATAELGIVDGVWAAALALALMVQLVRRREAPEIFAVASLVLLLFYTGVATRLLMPTYFVALAALLEFLRLGTGWLLPPPLATALPAALVIGIAGYDAELRWSWEKLEKNHQLQEQYFAALSEHLPEDARIAAFSGFAYNVFLEQPTFSLKRAIVREGVRDGLDLILERYDVDTVVLSPERGIRREQLELELRRRAGPPQRVGSARVWRFPR
jgi:4-amino-4-deoxy-L-arabinose transferase-like glycosyltransferase